MVSPSPGEALRPARRSASSRARDPHVPSRAAPHASPPGSLQHLQPPRFSRDGGKMKTWVCAAVFRPGGLRRLLEEPLPWWPGPGTPPGDASGEGKAAQSPFACSWSTREGPGKGRGGPESV